ncbi:NUDIX domain-containing protein [Nonomuraea sp. NPDC050328]|uniref:NUDIX domain-containing protein n=1 Tax=Nonomuraea sp. NPDC050328 TaxID=3364361 RepID=UPI00378DA873
MRPSVRGLLFDSADRLILFRRTVPGRAVYFSVPGGHVEDGDAGLEGTLRRELLEELGATVERVTPLTTLAYPWRGRIKVQHVYGCRLRTMDPALRHGPEVDDPARGDYEVVRLAADPAEIISRPIVPPALAGYLAARIELLPALIGSGPASPTDDPGRAR